MPVDPEQLAASLRNLERSGDDPDVVNALAAAMMACVEPANPGGGLAAAPGVLEGGIARSLWAIVKRIAR